MKRLFQIVDAKGKPLRLLDCNDQQIDNAFSSKEEAKAYRAKVDGTFASFITYGPDHDKYNPKKLPRNNKGKHPKRAKAKLKSFGF